MDSKNAQALTYGAEYLLSKFVNLPDSPDNAEPAREFQGLFGDLYSGLDPSRYWVHVFIFRNIWKWRDRPAGAQDAGVYVRNVFNRELAGMPETGTAADPRFRPALTVDFAAGRIAVVPDTLLDFLALSVLVHNNDLAYCERRKCPHPYFVKTHSRQRFCSHECANSVRQKKKERWWRDNREAFTAKWRKERKLQKSERKRKENTRVTQKAR